MIPNHNNSHFMGGSTTKVLMYHRVLDDSEKNPSFFWCVTQSQLRTHLGLLQKWGYTCISFEDHSLAMKEQLILPKKPVILTFDDGYEGVYKYALPIMKEFGVRATVFAIGNRSIRSNLWDSYVNSGGAPLLSDEMICDLHRLGFEIGSHSMTHPDLTKLQPNEAWDEITRSKVTLENLIQAPVISFAYPYGLSNAELEGMVKSAGYDYGVGVFSGPPRLSTNFYNIRRTRMVATTNTIEFAVKILTPYSHYRWLLWKARRRLAGHKSIPTSAMDTLQEKKIENFHPTWKV